MKQANSILSALVVCMIRCGGAFADGPAIVGQLPQAPPPPVKSSGYSVGINKFYPFKLQGYDGPITWIVNGNAVGFREFTKDSELFGVMEGSDSPEFKAVTTGSVVVWGTNQGSSNLVAWGVVDGKAKLLAELTIQVGPRPPPEPEPKPDPKPDPKPIGKLKEGFVVVLYDDKFMGAKAAKTLGNTQWKLDLGNIPGVLDFRPYDVTIADAAKKGYLAKGVEFLNDNKVYDWSRPVVMFLSKDAKVADIQFFDLDNAAKQIGQVISP